MAIDSAAKRKSISGIGMQFTAPGITNDDTPDDRWRRTSAWGYYGDEIVVVEWVLLDGDYHPIILINGSYGAVVISQGDSHTMVQRVSGVDLYIIKSGDV